MLTAPLDVDRHGRPAHARGKQRSDAAPGSLAEGGEELRALRPVAPDSSARAVIENTAKP